MGNFTEANTQVLAISTDFIATLNHWSKELGANFPFLSDYRRVVSKEYGVFNDKSELINRTTFVIDKDGKVVDITENRDAIDVTGTIVACKRLEKH